MEYTYWWAHVFLGRAYVQKGELERAVVTLRDAALIELKGIAEPQRIYGAAWE